MRAALLTLLVLTLARLGLAGTHGLVIDEAYYAVWSRHLAAGYFDHPPAVAWMIAASRAVLGDSALGVRAGAVVLGALALLVLLPGARDARRLVLLATGAPVLALGGVVATPDAPLVAGWAIALAGALRGGRLGWLVAGLGVGLAGEGKYIGWGLWPLLVLGAPREWRAMWPGWLATAAVLAPNLAWNADHDWVSVRFQWGHGLAGGAPPGLRGAVELLLAQAGLLSPLLFLAALGWWGVSWRGDREDRLLWWTSAPAVIFFLSAATLARPEANWPLPAWLGALVGLARAGGRWPRLVRLAEVGAWLGIALSLAAVLHLYVPWLPVAQDPAARLGEGERLAGSVQAWGVEPVYTTRYQEAAALSWYAGLEAYALPGVDRPDQYDLWPVRWSSPALFVRPCKGGTTLASDAYCPTRGWPGLADGGGHRVQDASGCWQVYVVGDCRAPAPTAAEVPAATPWEN